MRGRLEPKDTVERFWDLKFILGGREVGWREAPVTAGAWKLRAAATHALGIPSLARGGKLSQTSDRLYSCGFADWQSRPSSATGAIQR